MLEKLKQSISAFFAHLKINRVIVLILVIVLVPVLLFALFTAGRNESDIRKDESVSKFFRSAYEPDQLIIKLKNQYTVDELRVLDEMFKSQGVIGQEKAYESDKPYLIDYYLLQFKKGTDLESVKQVFDESGLIDISHPNYIFVIQQTTPNDPLYSQQWDLAKIGMPAAWEKTGGANNIRVAVIDTGIDFNHEDFSGRTIIKGKNYAYCQSRNKQGFCKNPPTDNPLDDHGHGTHVAGTIGAVVNNGKGIAGMLWNTTLVAVKAMKNDGRGKMPDIVNGMQNAMDLNARVINLSLTSGEGVNICNQDTVPELQNTIQDAIDSGIVVIVAAGNQNQLASNESPPSCRGAIVVGAVNSEDKRWVRNAKVGSNYGSRVDISAPGVGILSTFANNKYALNEGTSMAAPHVAAAAALLLSLNPSLTPSQVRTCLVNSGDPISADQPLGRRLNVDKALAACTGQTSQQVITPMPTSATPQRIVVGQVVLPVYTTPSQTSTQKTQINPNESYQLISETDLWYLIRLNDGTQGWITKTGATKSLSPVTVTTKPQTTSPSTSKTYTCRQAQATNPSGSIQIGNLICTPN